MYRNSDFLSCNSDLFYFIVFICMPSVDVNPLSKGHERTEISQYVLATWTLSLSISFVVLQIKKYSHWVDCVHGMQAIIRTLESFLKNETALRRKKTSKPEDARFIQDQLSIWEFTHK